MVSRIKPLAWDRPYKYDHTWYAESILGVWSAWEIGAGYLKAPWDKAGRKVGNDIDAAKAAAQAEYEDIIRSALVP